MSRTELQEESWLRFTENEYYNRIRILMINAGMGEGDTENALANIWKSAWAAGYESAKSEDQP